MQQLSRSWGENKIQLRNINMSLVTSMKQRWWRNSKSQWKLCEPFRSSGLKTNNKSILTLIPIPLALEWEVVIEFPDSLRPLWDTSQIHLIPLPAFSFKHLSSQCISQHKCAAILFFTTATSTALDQQVKQYTCSHIISLGRLKMLFWTSFALPSHT